MNTAAWSRSGFSFFLAFCLLIVAVFGLEHFLPQRPALRIGIEVLFSAALLAYWVWFEGWRKFLRETVPGLFIWLGIVSIADRVDGGLPYDGIGGFFCTCLVLMLACGLQVLYLRLIGAIRKG
jgi:hypothetical protein